MLSKLFYLFTLLLMICSSHLYCEEALSIINCPLLTSRKHILLTGHPGIGKSTIVKKVINALSCPKSGVYAEEVRLNGERVGFLVCTLDGTKDYLAHQNIESEYRVGSYGVNIGAINSLVIPAIVPKDSSVIIIDEIGLMQCCAPNFLPAVTQALDSGQCTFGTISLQNTEPLLAIKNREDVQIIEVTAENRDFLPEMILKHLSKQAGLMQIKNDVSEQNFAIRTYQREEVIPLLPILYQWSLAFQQPPYSFAGFHEDDLIDSQDTMYVNERNALVVVARIGDRIVGIGAGLPFDSRYVISYFENTQQNFYTAVASTGYDASNLFYITFILTAAEYRDNQQLSVRIFEEFSRFGIGLGQTGVCRMEDTTVSSKDPIETWVRHVGGFKKMGITLNKTWLTYMDSSSVQEREHRLEFFLKKL